MHRASSEGDVLVTVDDGFNPDRVSERVYVVHVGHYALPQHRAGLGAHFMVDMEHLQYVTF